MSMRLFPSMQVAGLMEIWRLMPVLKAELPRDMHNGRRKIDRPEHRSEMSSRGLHRTKDLDMESTHFRS